MTDNIDPEPPVQNRIEQERDSVDWFLETLVDLSNKSGMEMSLTLLIGGTTVTGTLISARSYFDRVSEIFGSATGDKSATEPLAEMASKISENYASREQSTIIKPTTYIHMRDARLCDSSGNPSGPPQLWRGMLTSVGGFHLGHYS